ncbi:MAG: RNA polymerase sporulation sigma factor SigG [Oscillospiraceae bacterium]|nr:RNA polymerase sporulation sigma factor SigG [Oscillospiraceae bacterium]
MLNKVDICGVNTSKLRVLKNAETISLIEKARQGDESARQELIAGNLRLVLSVIQRFTGRGEPPDDLFQVGCIGLIKAIDHFDTSMMVKFSTYGVPMIIGEIRRYLRDNSAVRVSRSLRDTAYKVMQAREELTAKEGREPSVEKIATHIGVSVQDVVCALDAVADPVSLNEPVYSGTDDNLCVMDQIRDKSASDEEWMQMIALKDAFAALDEREKRILALRFYEGKTQMEVSREIGISQAQVSRLEKSVIGRIKKNL